MSNTIGTIYKFTIWGQSHAPAVGVTIEGIPAGTEIDPELLQAFLDRRKPGNSAQTTARNENDVPEFVAGFGSGDTDGGKKIITCGSPVTALIRNKDSRKSDYDELRYVPRPGHADFPAMVRFGNARDYSGGGQFSGRLTAPLCIAGGIALQILKKRGITVSARPVSIGGRTTPIEMDHAIKDAAANGDSVGGIIECIIDGITAGVGEPMFDGIENRLAQTVFGIPAVKGIEFGNGFECADLTGSENNDQFVLSHDSDSEITERVRTSSNNHGGVLGGMTTGMPVVFRVAIKPTPSVMKEQDGLDLLSGESVKLIIKGRHDPCIVPRAIPAVEAAAACAVYDLIRIRESE